MAQKKWPQSRKCLTFYSASPQLRPFGEDEKESRVVGREGKETGKEQRTVGRGKQMGGGAKCKKKRDKKVENKKERSRHRAEEDGERCGAE